MLSLGSLVCGVCVRIFESLLGSNMNILFLSRSNVNTREGTGAEWPSGSVLVLRLRGCGFKPHRTLSK